MLTKFDIWQYRDNHNCWDYVRQFLIENACIPPEDVPKYGIIPNDKRAMTAASKEVGRRFFDSDPCQFAIACQYHGEVLIHVGVVDNGMVRHTGKRIGTLKSTFHEFEAMSQKTIYKLHESLWPS